MTEQPQDEVEALSAVIRDAIKRRTLQPLYPGGPGGMGATEYDIARDVLAAGYTRGDDR